MSSPFPKRDLGFEEEGQATLEKLQASVQMENHDPFSLAGTCPHKEKETYIKFLKQNLDVFAWAYRDASARLSCHNASPRILARNAPRDKLVKSSFVKKVHYLV